MSDTVDYLELVRKAQIGDQQSLSSLADLVEGRIFAYIYRCTLNRDLAQDLLQDTLLEMVKSLKNLKFEHINQFWAWLFKTASSKFQLYLRGQRYEKKVKWSALQNGEFADTASTKDSAGGIQDLMRKEISGAVFAAMAKLSLRYRNILVLRCFEQMPYSQVAAIMDCSEMAAQVLFFRAKQSLKRQLSHRGFGKGYLLAALAAFAKATAPAEASSAAVTVTTASLKVGLTAAVVGAVGTKLGTTAAVAVAVTALTVGGITVSSNKAPVAPVEKGRLEYPSSLVAAYDADNSGWEGRDIQGSGPVVPDQWLVGPPPAPRSAVSLPTDHWVELKFRSQIIDGPGDDIIIVEWNPMGEEALVFITDGAEKEHLLGTAVSRVPSRRMPGAAYADIGFDIAGLSLPFVPCAVRVVGKDRIGDIPGFDLCCVGARTKSD